MLVGQQSRPGSALWALCLGAIFLAAPAAVSANPLDEQACQRLRTEQQALTVLGIDKLVEKGVVWAKERLTPADLNQVKRYLEVFEQIKFRCDKIVAIAEPEEKDEDDDDGNAGDGSAPPMPERKSVQPVKSTAAPAVAPAVAPAIVPLTKSNSAAKTGKAPFGSANASAIQAGPLAVAPAR